uniref:Na_Ca_ex domain-containing protein n=1 Tax=Steinernema glaseri TaxID=37863 RepID=A0A1I8AJA0_9BILA
MSSRSSVDSSSESKAAQRCSKTKQIKTDKRKPSTSLLNFLIVVQFSLSASLALSSLIGVGVGFGKATRGFLALSIAHFVGCLPGVVYVFKDSYVLLVEYVFFQSVVALSETAWGIAGVLDADMSTMAIVALSCLPLNIFGIVIGTWCHEYGLPPFMERSKFIAALTRRRAYVCTDKRAPFLVKESDDGNLESHRFNISSLGPESGKFSTSSVSSHKAFDATSGPKDVHKNADTDLKPTEKPLERTETLEESNELKQETPLVPKRRMKQLVREVNTSF